MSNLGLPVPPRFTITTDAYLRHGSPPDGLNVEVSAHLALVEEAMGRTLGDAIDPLLVSVRSGAKFSIRDPASCVFDSPLTQASRTLVKVFGWYDNEWGHTSRLVDLADLAVLVGTQA